MTRVRYDPAFFDGALWEQLGADAVVLHDRACAYVVETLSDGFVSTGRALTLSPIVRNAKRTVRALVEANVWREVDGGYVVCECRDDLRHSDGRGDEQPSKAYVERERGRARKRQEEWRRRNGKANADSDGGANGVTNGSRHSTDRSGAGASRLAPAPELAADDAEVVCEQHGSRGGELPDGLPRCPACRRRAVKAAAS